MNQESKQWGDLTVLEQVRRSLLAEEGIVCIDCGQPAERICDDCRKQFEFECERDYYEQRFHEDENEDGEHGEETIRIVDKATGELIDEFTTVSIHDEPTLEKLERGRQLGWW